MATGKNNEELRQQAIRNLAASRAEISAEVHDLRLRLSPKRVISRLVSRHPGVVAGIAIAVVAVPVFLIFRSRSDHPRRRPVMKIPAEPESKPSMSSYVLATLARAAAPALIKWAIGSPAKVVADDQRPPRTSFQL